MMANSACAPLWRWGSGFRREELEERLAALAHCRSSGPVSDAEDAHDASWHHYYSEALIAREKPGPAEPGAAFERARSLIADYSFSDPSIVRGYFATGSALKGRAMLLELQVLGLHFLCGVVVRETRDEVSETRSVFGFRYDTLEGHLESGAEWFLLSKDHASGEVSFRIQAAWRQGDMPNWWMALGFHALSRPYQRAWHRQAYQRLRTFVQAHDLPPLPRGRAIMHAWRPNVPASSPIAESET